MWADEIVGGVIGLALIWPFWAAVGALCEKQAERAEAEQRHWIKQKDYEMASHTFQSVIFWREHAGNWIFFGLCALVVVLYFF